MIGQSLGAPRILGTTHLPQAVPEIPGATLITAAEYYVKFSFDGGSEVDELFERWKEAGAAIVERVADKPRNLREFRVADLDGNQLRVFYDFNWEMGGPSEG